MVEASFNSQSEETHKVEEKFVRCIDPSLEAGLKNESFSFIHQGREVEVDLNYLSFPNSEKHAKADGLIIFRDEEKFILGVLDGISGMNHSAAEKSAAMVRELQNSLAQKLESGFSLSAEAFEEMIQKEAQQLGYDVDEHGVIVNPDKQAGINATFLLIVFPDQIARIRFGADTDAPEAVIDWGYLLNLLTMMHEFK